MDHILMCYACDGANIIVWSRDFLEAKRDLPYTN